jgi:hypothetical protein
MSELEPDQIDMMSEDELRAEFRKVAAEVARLREELRAIEQLSSDYDSTDPYGGTLQSIHRTAEQALATVRGEQKEVK